MNMPKSLEIHNPEQKLPIQDPSHDTAYEQLMQEPPIHELLMQEPPIQEPAVQEPPVQEPPVQEPPVQEPPVEEPPVQELSIRESSVPEWPIQEPPLPELPVPEPSKQELPVPEPTIQELPVQEPPVQDPPVQEEVQEIQMSDDNPRPETTIEKLRANSTEKLPEIQNDETSMDIENENENIKDTEVMQSVNWFYYKWNDPPRLLCKATEEYQPSESCENFTKGCQWSPDGTCLLVPSEDFRLRIYELPRELYSDKIPSSLLSTNFSTALTIKEGGLIYDTCWFPFMNSWDPATCCFLSTSRESPIHLWDAFNGELRATYRAYNQVDEVEAAISIQFIDSAKEVWAGFKNALRVFDMERPGRQTETIQFKKDFPNVGGLVSCIRENPIMPGLVAFGTYSKYIGLYKNGPLCTFKTGSGVTQIEFSPCGTKLFSAVRRNNEFLCWDLRNPGMILYSLQGRLSDTNQRIQFNLAPGGKHIVSGGTNGEIAIWELAECTDIEDLNAIYKINLSHDCINGISLHRTLPIIATSTGQRLCDSTIQNRDNGVRLWSFF